MIITIIVVLSLLPTFDDAHDVLVLGRVAKLLHLVHYLEDVISVVDILCLLHFALFEIENETFTYAAVRHELGQLLRLVAALIVVVRKLRTFLVLLTQPLTLFQFLYL